MMLYYRYVNQMKMIRIEIKLFSYWMTLKFLASMAHVSLIVLHIHIFYIAVSVTTATVVSNCTEL